MNLTVSFSIKRRVQFAETDLAGVMHFANYFRIMEEVEHAFWRSAGSSVHVRRGDETISWPRVAVQCEYLAPVRFEDELDVSLAVASVTDKSVEFTLDFLHEGQPVARGKVRAVCCRVSDRFEAISIPDDARQALSTLAGTKD